MIRAETESSEEMKSFQGKEKVWSLDKGHKILGGSGVEKAVEKG